MLDRGFDMSNPRYKKETILESIFRQTEKQYGEWKTKDWIIKAGVAIIAMSTFNALKPEVKEVGNMLKKVTGINWISKKLKGKENTVSSNIFVKIGLKKASELNETTPKKYIVSPELEDGSHIITEVI